MMAQRAWRRVCDTQGGQKKLILHENNLRVQENMEASAQAGDPKARDAAAAISASASKTTGGVRQEKRKST